MLMMEGGVCLLSFCFVLNRGGVVRALKCFWTLLTEQLRHDSSSYEKHLRYSVEALTELYALPWCIDVFALPVLFCGRCTVRCDSVTGSHLSLRENGSGKLGHDYPQQY